MREKQQKSSEDGPSALAAFWRFDCRL